MTSFYFPFGNDTANQEHINYKQKMILQKYQKTTFKNQLDEDMKD